MTPGRWAVLASAGPLAWTVGRWASEAVPIIILCIPIACLLAVQSGPARPIHLRGRRDR